MKVQRILYILFAGLLLAGSMAVAQDDNETCLSCHADKDLTGLNKAGDEISMFVSASSIDSSVHAGMGCVDCHQDLAGGEEYPHADELQKAACGTCHDDVAEIYNSSAHGMAVNNPNAPSCASCHSSHKILSHTNPEATTSKKNLPYTCSSCHHRLVLTDDPDVKLTNSFDRYMRGIHAEGISRGIQSAASCDDCHGMHDLKRASDPQSMVNKMNLPKTCAKCHNDIYIQYSRGIHGKALALGILDSPNCADCHGEHEILSIADPNSPVNTTNVSDYVCGRCHNDPQVAEKFGLGGERFTSYQDTYHGLAVKGGSVKAASCASCHRAHEILPSANPASSIHPDNLTKTCQKCHANANFAFASSYTHETASLAYNELNSTVEFIYIIAIVLIIGGMLVHNGIILTRYLIDKNRENRGQPQVRRFTGNVIFQHMIVTIAFIVLVVTGFALRYPDSWWVGILNTFGIYEGARGVIHRIAAVLLIYISLHHALYLFLTRNGRRQFKALLPSRADFTQPLQNIRYHLGLTTERPKFDFYDYTEKAEYWALVWGTFVMAFTGFVLWFPTFFTSFMPAWIVKISETVHLYEAWLATLAIAVFHFFFVIFHPEQYPMSFTWITGTMTVNEVKHHHPLWYEQVQKMQAEPGGNEPPQKETTTDH